MPTVDTAPARQAANAGRAPPPAHVEPAERMVRCTAGFYGDVRTAEATAEVLCAQFGLAHEQVDVILPAGLTRAAFARAAQHWQCLRPRWSLGHQALRLAFGTVVGMVLGGMVGSIGWALLQGSDPGLDAMDWLLSGLWLGAVAGAATVALVFWRQPRHRFDDTVARKLRNGYSVVVAHGLGDRHEAPVLAYLQDTSHSWCAEAPRREERI